MALSDNLISYWKFDESSGNATDSVSGNTITTANATYGAAVINNGLITNGTTTTARAANSIVTSGTVISISVWLKNGAAGQAVDTMVITNQYDTGQTGILVSNQTGSANDYSFAYGDGTVYRGLSTGKFSISTSAFEHYVFIINGTSRTIYRNGSSIVSDTPGGGSVSFASAGVFSVGVFTISNIRYWNGKADELGVWDKALSSGEVTQLYNGGAGLAYPFGEGGGSPVKVPSLLTLKVG